MNDDVVTGGHKFVHSPVNKHSRPEITVSLPDQETVARSLDFDNLTTESQFAPDTLQSGSTLETTAEAISRSASPVLNPKVHPKNSQLLKLRRKKWKTYPFTSRRHSQPHPIPTGAATTDSTGTTDARDQLTAEEVGQFPRSQQTEQRTARRGDQTNALPNQNPIETTAITGYHGTDITAIRVTTAITAAVENP
ncbi:hypothetical protein OUZ56_023297 [Daphnia magna]|uniref:Uncharacterized protein n=1 Tax=Daphnia magna TaxID=35525 RepID=A0ABR0AZ19_9CRUS|nr:hypothetical protein OUZ56_023297 [Daphnia magna]